MKIVLSIDGGGIRGIIPALILAEIEKRVGRPAAQLFDLAAGTSTGGIIALLLSCGYSAARAAQMYREEGERIFSRSIWGRVGSVGGLSGPKYDCRNIEQILFSYFGSLKLSDAALPVMVCSYDVSKREPYFFKSWRDETKAVPMRLAARATSAAPTFFDSMAMTIDDRHFLFVDGGVCVNNPAVSAAAEARKRWKDEPLLVVSLGTGQHTRPLDSRGWGLTRWAVPITNVFMDGQSDVVDYQLNHLLAENFIRFQTELTIASDDMDNASPENIEKLTKEATKLLSDHSKNIDRLCDILSSHGASA